MHKVGL